MGEAGSPAGSSSARAASAPSTTARQRTHLDVPLKVPHGAHLGLHALEALALELRGRLHGVPDGGLDDAEEDARADDRVRAERHEHVREPVDGHRDVRRRVWGFPFFVQAHAVPPYDVEGELPGGVVACGVLLVGVGGRGREEGTCCAEDDVELLVLPVFGLDSGLCDSLDGTRDEIGLQNIISSALWRVVSINLRYQQQAPPGIPARA